MASDLPVDLLEEIFLRVDDVADLVRASAACASFRRVITDGRFRRRFRLLHRPPILGFLDCLGGRFDFYAAEPPCSSAPAARALARAADFSSSSLPEPTNSWRVRDVRDGRVVFSQSRRDAVSRAILVDYVVYDPLHRRHVEIPPIPSELVPHPPGHRVLYLPHYQPFLLPAAAAADKKKQDDGDDHASFQLMCNVLSEDSSENAIIRTFVCSLVTATWRGVATLSSGSYSPPSSRWVYSKHHYVRGCFYLVIFSERTMLLLDTREMKLSVVNLPPGSEHRHKVIVETADQDRVGLLILGDDEHMLDLYNHKASCWGGAGADEDGWRYDNGVRLILGYRYCSLRAVAEGYALLRGVPRDEDKAWRAKCCEGPRPKARYFTVDVSTLLLEQLCVLEMSPITDFLYASFPPPFAPPSV